MSGQAGEGQLGEDHLSTTIGSNSLSILTSILLSPSRLERDYSLAPSHLPQYHSTFPLELEGRLPVSRFCEAMNEINEIMIQANDPTWAALDNGLAVMTFWFSPWIVGSRFARVSDILLLLPCQ